ncbi:MAG: MFS transporter [Chloroflexi bacterium]|nr:MFS transporter [Chloroflexota bacterium]
MRFTGLWRHPEFLKLWAGQTVSVFGSQITLLALPLTAVLTLGASPLQMGFLRAAGYAPFLLFGLIAGVWVDRLPRRPILIGADAGRALLLASIPIAAAFDVLHIAQIYVVSFLAGILTVFFDVAYLAVLPSLVKRQQVVEANSKLQVTVSVSQLAGPGAAGSLTQAVSAPVAVAADALSFVASALFLTWLRVAELPRRVATERRNIWAEIGEGLRVVTANPLLRAGAACTATINLFHNMNSAVVVLYLTREGNISPGLLGVIYTVASSGLLLGSLLVGRITKRLGLGTTLSISAFLFAVYWLVVPADAGGTAPEIVLLTLGMFLGSFGAPIFNINLVSLRQVITPDHLLGRVNATMRFLVWGVIPLGSVLGGVLGSTIGLRPTLTLGSVGLIPAFLWIFLSPMRRMRALPVAAEEPAHP